MGDAAFMDHNKYLLLDPDPMATMTTARKILHGGDGGASSREPPSPDKIDVDEYSHLLKMTHGSKEDLSVLTADMAAKGLFGGSHMPAGMHQEFLAQHSDALAMAK